MKSSVPQVPVVALALAVLSSSTPCRADDGASAEALFRQGRAQADAADYDHACPAFAESFRLEPAPGTLLNLADCEEHLGRLASAWGHFLRVETLLADNDERRILAHDRALALSHRMPQLTIVLALDAPPDARVVRDDVDLGRPSLAVPLPVDPGPHAIIVTAQGREPRTFWATATEGHATSIVVSPGPPPALVEERARNPGLAPGWLVGGAGVVSLGVGAFFGGRALSEHNQSDATCNAGACSTSSGLATYEAARSDALVADVAIGVGVAAVAVGGWMLLTSGSGSAPRSALLVSARGVGATW